MKLRNRGPPYWLRSRVGDPKPHEFRSAKRRTKSQKISESARVDEAFRQQSIDYATRALCFLRSHQNLDYELVEPGCIGGTGISKYFIFHTNFQAKLRGCPDAPVQTFFAQLRLPAVRSWGPMVVDCCVNLGPTDQLPKEVYSGGCRYCAGNFNYHPIGGCEKLLRGNKNDDCRWLYGDSVSGFYRFREDSE